MGSVAKSYMRMGFLKYEKVCKYLTILEEAVSHMRKIFFSFLSVYSRKRFVRHCLEWNLLSNSRRIHSEEEDEEKRGTGVTKGSYLLLNNLSPLPPPPPHTARLLHCLGLRYQDIPPPLIVHSHGQNQ
jgi:hypothetical protein